MSANSQPINTRNSTTSKSGTKMAQKIQQKKNTHPAMHIGPNSSSRRLNTGR